MAGRGGNSKKKRPIREGRVDYTTLLKLDRWRKISYNVDNKWLILAKKVEEKIKINIIICCAD
jgi:hypothetical protein